MGQTKRAWIYCRIDASEDLHGALKRQRQQLMDYAEQMGFEVAGSSQDQASGLRMNRPGLNEVMEAARVGRLDVLIVRDISRVGRDTCQTMEYLEQLSRMGVQTCSPMEGVLDFTFQKVIRDALSHMELQ